MSLSLLKFTSRKAALGLLVLTVTAGLPSLAGGPSDATRSTPSDEATVSTPPPCSASSPVMPELTDREARKLARSAKTADDHRKLVLYYRAEAEKLEAQAVAYDRLAASCRQGPMVKNLISPTTAPRYEYLAGECRKRARSNHMLADSHDKIARSMAVADSQVADKHYDASQTAASASPQSK